MRALVTGATGFIGPHLLRRLDRPVVLSRNADQTRRALAQYNVEAYSWDPLAAPPPLKAFDGIDTIFHMAGEPVASGRWTAAKKRRIRDSRELGTRHLVQAPQTIAISTGVLVSASATGWYGDRGDQILERIVAAFPRFSGRSVRRLGARSPSRHRIRNSRSPASAPASCWAPRVGALKKLLPPFRFGLGGPLGSGHQWMPWIHVDDLVSIYLHAAQQPNVFGPLDATGAKPRNQQAIHEGFGRRLASPGDFPRPVSRPPCCPGRIRQNPL